MRVTRQNRRHVEVGGFSQPTGIVCEQKDGSLGTLDDASDVLCAPGPEPNAGQRQRLAANRHTACADPSAR